VAEEIAALDEQYEASGFEPPEYNWSAAAAAAAAAAN